MIVVTTTSPNGTKVECSAAELDEIAVQQSHDKPYIDLFFKAQDGTQVLISFDKQLLLNPYLLDEVEAIAQQQRLSNPDQR